MEKIKVFFLCVTAFILHTVFSLYGTSDVVRTILNSMSGFIGNYSPHNNLRMTLDILISSIIMAISVWIVFKMVKEKVLTVVCFSSVPISFLYLYLNCGNIEFPLAYNFACVFSTGVLPIVLAIMIRNHLDDQNFSVTNLE